MSDATAVTDEPVGKDGPEVIRDVADQIIKRHSIYGALGGLLPLPVFDVAVIVGVQIKMICTRLPVLTTDLSGGRNRQGATPG